METTCIVKSYLLLYARRISHICITRWRNVRPRLSILKGKNNARKNVTLEQYPIQKRRFHCAERVPRVETAEADMEPTISLVIFSVRSYQLVGVFGNRDKRNASMPEFSMQRHGGGGRGGGGEGSVSRIRTSGSGEITAI